MSLVGLAVMAATKGQIENVILIAFCGAIFSTVLAFACLMAPYADKNVQEAKPRVDE